MVSISARNCPDRSVLGGLELGMLKLGSPSGAVYKTLTDSHISVDSYMSNRTVYMTHVRHGETAMSLQCS